MPASQSEEPARRGSFPAHDAARNDEEARAKEQGGRRLRFRTNRSLLLQRKRWQKLPLGSRSNQARTPPVLAGASERRHKSIAANMRNSPNADPSRAEVMPTAIRPPR